LVIDIYGDGPIKLPLKNKGQTIEVNFNFKGSVSNLKELYCQYDYMLQPHTWSVLACLFWRV
jgi:hypothetical protein